MRQVDGFDSARATARAVQEGHITARELVDRALARAEEITELNAFTVIDAEGARRAAGVVDALPAKARAGKSLLGVCFAAKDFTPTAGHLCTRGSWSMGDVVPDTDPVLIRRLKDAGAILIGKTTTPEFAYSSFTWSTRWGMTRNPHDPTRTPGGSSGGSGVAVATGCVRIAEGTDMGGSVRIPAALSGVVGFKPSRGRIPMDILPLGPDILSHFGPLAAQVDDAALFMEVAQGPDVADWRSWGLQDVPRRREPGHPAWGCRENHSPTSTPTLGYVLTQFQGTQADLDGSRPLHAVVLSGRDNCTRSRSSTMAGIDLRVYRRRPACGEDIIGIVA